MDRAIAVLASFVSGSSQPAPRGPRALMSDMLSSDNLQAASDMLTDAWSRGDKLDALPPGVRPATRADGYAIQQRIEALSSQPLFGWKIAATSIAGQRHIGVDGPLAGRLLAERVLPPGSTIDLAGNLMRVAEVEFAFRMGADLAPRDVPYEVDEVMAAVATLHPAIEIPDSRYSRFTEVGAPQLIADNACAHLFVLAPPTEIDWRAIDLSRQRVWGKVLGRYERDGSGANALGDPRIALTWIANELSRLGITLGSGQVVTTGTCVTPLDVRPGDRVEVDLGEIGSTTISFA